MATPVLIQDFTDPTCPFAYSLEPVRWRLRWLYGDQINWQTSMIVLHEEIDPNSKLTPERIAKNYTKLRDYYGMPINDQVRSRLSSSLEVCRAYIAVYINAPDKADTVLRQLRIATMRGDLPDDPQTVTKVIDLAGINQQHFADWMNQTGVEALLRSDMREAREPDNIALALRHKLVHTPEGTKRYSAGSYRFIINDTIVFELPGFWPSQTYEAAMANIAPALIRKDDAHNASEVLEWAGEPLATVEVAAIINKPVEEVRLQLQKVAIMEPVGQDGFWKLTT